jgi:predicted nucleic acid-binding protein
MSPDTYLLDTNILIEFFTKKEETVSILAKLRKSGTLYTSLLSVAEIRMGWNDKDAAVFLPALYGLFGTRGLSPAIVELAGKWRREYKERGVTLSSIDTLIAATAQQHDMYLVTRNTKHFPMPELRLYMNTPSQ